MAEVIQEHLEDKEWARKVYKKADAKKVEEKPADDLFKLEQFKQKQDSKLLITSFACLGFGGPLLVHSDGDVGLIIMGIVLIGLGVLIWPRKPKN